MKFKEIIQSDKPVLVDFHATWCNPCKTMAPVLDKVKSKVGSSATILKIDVDKNPNAAAQYQIKGVPTFILFKSGKIMWRKSGVVSMNELEQVIKANQ